MVERRSALGRPERFPEIAAEVVRLNPDVIRGKQPVLRAVKAAPRRSRSRPVAQLPRGIRSRHEPGPARRQPDGPDACPPGDLRQALELLRSRAGDWVADLTTRAMPTRRVGTLLRDGARRLGVTLVPVLMMARSRRHSTGGVPDDDPGRRAGGADRDIGEHFANRRPSSSWPPAPAPTMAPGREFVAIGSLMAYGELSDDCVALPPTWRRS